MNSHEPPEGAAPPAESPSPPPPPPAAEPPAPLPSLPSRMLGVLASPGKTFKAISGRPVWAGALILYLVLVGVSTLVYSFNVDWNTMFRAQLESSLFWKFATSVMSESDLETIERSSLNEIESLGTGGMALNTTLQSVVWTVMFFHFMLILFVTLFYLMGALADLKLGRVYLDGLLCLLVLLLSAILSAFVRGLFGLEGREALPWQAGLTSVFFIGYLWLFYRSVERQPDLKRMAAAYAHSMAVPALYLLAMIAITLLKSEPLTVPGDQVVASSLGAILGMKTGVLGVLLGALEVFAIWGLAVAAIGFAAASRLSMGTAAAITFLPWGFYTMARIALAAAFGS